MPRWPRGDTEGAWLHVMHRGIARRPVFESRRDIRYFLSLVAREVRRGDLEVHAFCVMATHFHMLVRSPRGRLSAAMKRILNAYVRYFNRVRRRDGSLFRGRFRSKIVDSLAYRSFLVSYIDDNAVDAALVPSAAGYPWSSARWYAREKGPPWLSRGWVESEVMAKAGTDVYVPDRYEERFPTHVEPAFREWVERCLEGGCADGDFDDLVSGNPERVREWMHRRARLADGTPPGLPILPAAVLIRAVNRLRPVFGERKLGRRNAWDLILPGLLRDACALRVDEIALRLRIPATTTRDRIVSHRRYLSQDAHHAQRTEQVLSLALTYFPSAHRPH